MEERQLIGGGGSHSLQFLEIFVGHGVPDWRLVIRVKRTELG